jgi:hypothetical protein
MIYSHTLNDLSEEEISILYFIAGKVLTFEPNFDILKALRIPVILKILDVLKPQALEEKKEIFDKLKEKLSAQS